MKYEVAFRRAEALVKRLAPFCERIAIAGSVRRGKAECSDIDLVCIPKTITSQDLLGNPEPGKNLLYDELQAAVAKGGLQWVTGGGDPNGKNWILKVPLVASKAKLTFANLATYQLDIFTAQAENFMTRLNCRTGSMQHNILLAERAQRMGGKYRPTEGVDLGVLHQPQTEEEFYQLFGLPYIEPGLREADHMKRLDRQFAVSRADTEAP